MLAQLARDHPCELRADFQQYYGLNVDGMGRDFRVLHAADLASQLPIESRCARLLRPDGGWSSEAAMLAVVDFRLQQVLYSLAGGKDRSGRKLPDPKCIYSPRAEGAEGGQGMDVDEMAEFLSRPRTVKDGD